MKESMKITKNRKNNLSYQLRKLIGFLSWYRQKQLGLLFILLLLSSLSEMVSLGALLPFLGALSNADNLLSNSQWQPLLSQLNIGNTSNLVVLLAIGFISTVIIAAGFRTLALVVRVRLAAAISSDISNQIYHKTLQQPYSFHTSHNSSDLIQMVTGDVNQLSTGVLNPLLTLMMDALLIPALIGALVIIDGRIAISAALILGMSYVLIYQNRKKILTHNSKIATISGQRRIKAVQEGIGGVRDILLARNQNFFLQEYAKSERSFRNAKATNSLISGIPSHIIEAIAMASIALLALTLGKDGDFSQAVPVLGSLALGAKRLLPALQQAFYSFALIQGSRASLERVLTALELSVDPDLVQPSKSHPLFLENELCLDNLFFRYSNDTDWILKGVSLTIKARSIVGFVGSTGSGKSTTADLIMGLLQPQKGTVWIDGQPLQKEKLCQWQQGIAHVPQNIFLTDATLAENIAFGLDKEKIDFERVVKAAQLAQLDAYIKQLPAGYNTYVGERGIRLSGGQRQRIGIARALYRPASVVVFDEATSALDNATEKEVMESINNLACQYTVILIAHRLSTVEKCDVIFELNDGRVVAQGTYQDLIENSESFQKIAAL